MLPVAVLGQSAIPATPTTAKTSVSQRIRARRTVVWSSRAVSAATGEIRAARRAGSSAAATVTPKPSNAPRSSPPGGITSSRSASAPPPGDSSDVTAAASPTPTATPRATPATPRWTAEISTSSVTCRRVMPAARRSPTSRARSATVIASVLKMRNAPPKSARAATSAIVIRKSEVAARSRATSSSGVVRVYGSTESRRSSAAVTEATPLPRTRPRSTRSTESVLNRAWAAWSGTTMLRPAGSGSSGTGARIPDTWNVRGPDSADPLSVIVPPTTSPFALASASETRATLPPSAGSGEPRASGRSWSAASGSGSTPITVTGTGRPDVASGSGAGYVR